MSSVLEQCYRVASVALFFNRRLFKFNGSPDKLSIFARVGRLQTLLGTKSDFLSDAWRYLRSLKNRKKGSVKAILSKEKAAIAGILFIYQLISILFLFGLVLEEILCS